MLFRNIAKVLKPAFNMCGTKYVELECGHRLVVPSNAIKAVCRKCERHGPLPGYVVSD